MGFEVASPLTTPAQRPFVGRASELAALLEALQQPPVVAVIEGEAGVGKTRLVQELEALCPVRVFVVGRAHPVSDPFPLAPVVDALRLLDLSDLDLPRHVGVLTRVMPELQEALPPAPDRVDDARIERHRLFRAIRDLLQRVGDAVLVLEDLHWADDITVDFLATLIATMPPRLRLLCTFRRSDLDDTSSLPALVARADAARLNIGLDPLSVDEVRALVQALLGATGVSDEFVGYLYAKTGGLPFAVEELLYLLQDRHDIVHKDGRWERRSLERIEVPAAVRDHVIARLRLLPEHAQSVLAALAVLEMPLDIDLIATVSDLDAATAADGVDRALRSRLVVEHPNRAVGFAHDLARQAVYEAQTFPERQRLHARAARALEVSPRRAAARLAHHYKNAGDVGRWVRCAEEAAAAAIAAYDDAGAARLLQDVLDAPDVPQEDRVRLTPKLGEAALHGLAHDEAIRVLSRIVADAAVDVSTRGHIRLHLGLLLAQAGDASSGALQMKTVLSELTDPALRARALAILAVPWVVEGTASEHRAWLAEAADLLPSIADPVMSLRVRLNIAAARLFLADPQGWVEVDSLPDGGAAPPEHRQLMRGTLNAAQAAIYIGHYRRARDFLQRARELAEQVPYERLSGGIDTVELLLAWLTGEWNVLEPRARALREHTDAPRHTVVDLEVVLGATLLARDDHEGRDLLLGVLPTARATGSVPLLMLAVAALARDALVREDAAGALAYADPALDLLRAKDMWWWGCDLTLAATEAHVARGDIDRAEDLVAELAAGTMSADAPVARPATDEARAVVAQARGDDRVARAALDAAIEGWDALARVFDAARCRLRWAELVAVDDATAAQEAAMAGLTALEEIDARRDVAYARRALRKMGLSVPRPWRGGTRGYGRRLSPREREVVELAAKGHTNREIGATLFLSPKTVEHHLGSAMQKLGVSSRRALREASLDG